jgi:hypothetical protein
VTRHDTAEPLLGQCRGTWQSVRLC